MTKRAPKLIASAFLVVTLATACGGGGRPSADELADSMKDNAGDVFGSDVPEDSVDWDCFAKLYVDSDMSDEALRAMADNDEDYDLSDDDQEAFDEATGKATECVEMPEMPDLEDLETPSS